MVTSAQRARTPEGLLETGVPLDDATDTRRHRPFVNALPLPPGMPLVHVEGRLLSPPFAALLLGNQGLVAALSEKYVPPLTAADLVGVAFVHATRLRGLSNRERCFRAAEIVLALHPQLARAAGWPDDPQQALRLAVEWATSPRADNMGPLIATVKWETQMLPSLWRQAGEAIMDRAYDKAARAIARRRGWTDSDVDTALALGDLPQWRDRHGYPRIALLKALEPARLPEPAGSPTERVGETQDVAAPDPRGADPADPGADPEAIARLRAALGCLSPRELKVVTLLASGYTPEEAAADMGTRRATVYVLVSRAKKKIAAA